MQCPNCGQLTEDGRFCTSCGAQLPNQEYAATADPTINTPPQVHEQTNHIEQTGSAQQPPNETVEKLKATGSNFGHFFLTLLKSPSQAKKANSNDMVSGIITIVIFSLLIALGVHLTLSAASTGFFGGSSVSFFDSFLLPFIQFIILFGVIAALTFAGVKISGQTLSFPDVVAKYGGYLIPFLLLFVVGLLLSLIGISSLTITVILISLFGTLLVAPTLILFEQPANGFDRIYLLIGIYFISYLVFSYFVGSILQSIIGGMFGNFLGF